LRIPVRTLYARFMLNFSSGEKNIWAKFTCYNIYIDRFVNLLEKFKPFLANFHNQFCHVHSSFFFF
jgi:hypothetical protein